MSILIKGMAMPKNCWEDDCPCLDKQNGICQANADKGYVYSNKPSWCPLIEIPDIYIDMSKAFMTELTDKVCIKGDVESEGEE